MIIANFSVIGAIIVSAQMSECERTRVSFQCSTITEYSVLAFSALVSISVIRALIFLHFGVLFSFILLPTVSRKCRTLEM